MANTATFGLGSHIAKYGLVLCDSPDGFVFVTTTYIAQYASSKMSEYRQATWDHARRTFVLIHQLQTPSMRQKNWDYPRKPVRDLPKIVLCFAMWPTEI